MSDSKFEFTKEGKEITFAKYIEFSPEKIELMSGNIFWTEEDRLNMLGLLIENLGTDKVIEFINKFSS